MGVLKVTKRVLNPDWEALRITRREVGLRTRLSVAVHPDLDAICAAVKRAGDPTSIPTARENSTAFPFPALHCGEDAADQLAAPLAERSGGRG